MARARKKSASKQALTRDKVLKCAIQLADAQGVDGLSMRKLAKALNVEAMSLYNHVDNKDDLLDGMLDSVISEFKLPNETIPWREALRQSLISTHDVLLQHRWAALQLLSRISAGEAMMTYSNACYGCLYNAGFSHALTDHGWNALNNHLYGFTLSEINAVANPKDYAKTAEKYLPMVPKERYPYIRSMMEVIIEGSHSGINDFHFGLDLILDGLEKKRQESK